MAKLIGMGGSIQISSATYPVSGWSINETNEVQDVTDTGSGGWVARIAGVSSAEVTFKAFWGSGPADLATTFAVGTTGTLTCNVGSGGDSFDVPGIISAFSVTNNCKTPVEFNCTLQSNGAPSFS